MSRLEIEKFEPLLGEWIKYLKPIFESEEMYNLYQEFKSTKETVTPKSSDLFRFLQLCPPNELKVIIMGMDSYPGRYNNKELQATGIAFDCSNAPDKKLQPSLTAFWDGIRHDFMDDLPYENNLTFLCEQGVMLANRALNCKLYKTGSFIGKWDFFWQFFFETAMMNFPGVPVVFLGKDAKVLRKYVFEMNNPVFELNHPSFNARSGTLWETEKVFSKINKLIEQNNGAEFRIRWSKF